jgi:nucleotide-binding universal stress UspA family protein
VAIKDLLVAYQGDENSRTALTFALQMSRKYQAAVTGAHVQAPDQYTREVRSWIPQNVFEVIRKAEEEATKTIENSFREVVAQTSPETPHDWISGSGPPSLTLARLSRYFDILLTGQFEGAIRHGGRALQPEDLIRRSGKPMIIVPQSYEVRPFKEHAVVAWDGSASSARALTDAMQILETKKRLDVVTVESGDEYDRIPPLRDHDIIAHLQRHGIEAQAIPLKRRGSVGRTILDYCTETDPDVLVMGAFGRAKLGALLFGGVSQYILEHQTVPVMMSH